MSENTVQRPEQQFSPASDSENAEQRPEQLMPINYLSDNFADILSPELGTILLIGLKFGEH